MFTLLYGLAKPSDMAAFSQPATKIDFAAGLQEGLEEEEQIIYLLIFASRNAYCRMRVVQCSSVAHTFFLLIFSAVRNFNFQ
jgi:hypothetical protein